MLQYIRPTPLSLKKDPMFNEKWVQERIAEDPAILGLGDLELKDVEWIQPKAGRLDLLLRDPETDQRYEVELMLGTLDESHIIRTIEYWDIERKRYPQFDHSAVIIAEDITSRFLNVIGLFNSAIPIIAIQLGAYQIGDNILLTFTKVLDEIVRGDDDEDVNFGAETTDRAFWEKKASPESMGLSDECLSILKEINPIFGLKYNKYYIGVTEGGLPNNFVIFRAKKSYFRIDAKVVDMEAWKLRLEDAGLELMEKARNRIRIRVTKDDMVQNKALIKELFLTAYRDQNE